MAIKDKFKGIFNGDSNEKVDQNPNTPEQQKIVDMVLQDFETFKIPRHKMDDIWATEQRFYMGDHWHGLRSEAVSKLRPNAADNVAGSQIDSIVGKLTGWMPYPDFEAQEDGDEQKASDLNAYMPYELRQIKFKQKHSRAVYRMVIHGPLVYKVIYDPTIEGGRGMRRYEGRNDIVPVPLATFYPDPRVDDFIDLQSMSAIIQRTPRTLEYFRERFGEQGAKVQPDWTENGELSGFDGYDAVTGRVDVNVRSKVSGLLEYWYRGLPKIVTREDRELFREMAEEKLANGIDPSEYIAKSKGDMEGVHCIYVSTDGVFLEHKAYVYDHGEYPFEARTLCPEEGNIWGKGFMRDMIKPQIFKNKYAEIAIETMAKQGNSAIMYEEGSITKPRIWQEQRSQSGAMLPIARGMMEKVKELQGVNIPSSLFNMLNYYDEMLQKIPGQFDSANGQANSNVTSGEQAKALMAAASTRLNTVSSLIQETLEAVFAKYIELIAQFYTQERVARVTGKSISISRDALVNRVPTEFQGMEQAPDGLNFEPSPVEEEYVPTFDIMVHIGVDKPQDREYWMQLAFNLMNMKDPVTQLPLVDAEAVRYVIQTGRMEPMDVIKRRIEEQAGIQQQYMQAQQQAQQLQQENAQMQQAMAQLTDQKVQQEQQSVQFEQMLKQQRLELDAAKTANEIMKSNPTQTVSTIGQI